ncbi:hypothetical protein AcW1_008692 [Taiwanofungus camphoratus]|nr:hypothetical protein AcW1_008692 [Antrodia cinnamomea]
MPTPKRAPCQICRSNESKYTCAKCRALYCSLPCYKEHKATFCFVEQAQNGEQSKSAQPEPEASKTLDESATDVASANGPGLTPPPPPLRPLTSLRWPYVPEEPAYPDPLKRDDPKPLQLPQYEAIATSPSVRRALASHPQLPGLLRSIDQLRGPDREEALEQALGVSPSIGARAQSEEDTRALRELAEAIEAAVRGGKQAVLGLDWGD